MNISWNPRVVRALLYLAIFVWLASAITHVITFFGVAPQRAFPPVWGLAALTMALSLTALIISDENIRTFSDRMQWTELATRHAPRWVNWLTRLLVAYALFNFVWTIGYLSNWNPGGIDHKLTAVELEARHAYEFRGISSFLLVLLNFSTTVFLSKLMGGLKPADLDAS